jgi:hypothetical protein
MEIIKYHRRDGNMVVAEDGFWVKTDDHLAIVEKLKAEIEEAYERGFFNGACTGYGQG